MSAVADIISPFLVNRKDRLLLTHHATWPLVKPVVLYEMETTFTMWQEH